MKLIAVFMVILVALYPAVIPHESTGTTAIKRSLISEAAKAGRKQLRKKTADNSEAETTQEIIITTDVIDGVEAKQETPPAHEHNWISVTQTVHHDAVYQTVRHEAQTERVWIEDRPAYDETYETTRLVGMHDICKGCGLDITASGMTFEEYDAHDRQHVLNGEDSSYYSEPFYETVTETIHHEAEGHYEDLVVQEAYDETILVSEAWDEQVISGCRCRECGAMK